MFSDFLFSLLLTLLSCSLGISPNPLEGGPTEYTTELHEVLKLYGASFNEIELTTQLEIFSAKFSTSNKVTLRESIDYLRSLSAGQKQFFHQVY